MCPDCLPLYFPDFPITRPKSPGILDIDATGEQPNASAPKILIVDDDPSQIRTLVPFLREEGYTILIATDGPGALEIVSQETPDLILLDVMMPDMDGYEVCRRLKENPRHRQVPVIFVTGKSEEKDETEGFSLGAVDYISKPYSLPRVQARVRTHLELKRHRDELELRSKQDALTGLPNRRAFQEFLDFTWSQAIRQHSDVSVILLDVDHFKAFNDHYGHQAGDDCLRRVAKALQDAKRRSTDQIARYGGEEFVGVLPGTDVDGARIVAEYLRAAVESQALPHAHSSAADHVTVSLGVACAKPQLGESSSAFLKVADDALYQAKQGGRNRVEG
jgi:diguanylate cyclase (GGDEF)-like protein